MPPRSRWSRPPRSPPRCRRKPRDSSISPSPHPTAPRSPALPIISPTSTALTSLPPAASQLGELDGQFVQPLPGTLFVALASGGVATLRPRDLPSRLRQQFLFRPR